MNKLRNTITITLDDSSPEKNLDKLRGVLPSDFICMLKPFPQIGSLYVLRGDAPLDARLSPDDNKDDIPLLLLLSIEIVLTAQTDSLHVKYTFLHGERKNVDSSIGRINRFTLVRFLNDFWTLYRYAIEVPPSSSSSFSGEKVAVVDNEQ